MQAHHENTRGHRWSRRRERTAEAWPTFEVDYRIRVKAKDGAAAQRAFFRLLISGEPAGLDWLLVEDQGFRKVEVVQAYPRDPETDIRVTRR
jgi:hypothetical protein